MAEKLLLNEFLIIPILVACLREDSSVRSTFDDLLDVDCRAARSLAGTHPSRRQQCLLLPDDWHFGCTVQLGHSVLAQVESSRAHIVFVIALLSALVVARVLIF